MTIVSLIMLAVGTFAMKAAGPLAVGGRELPPHVRRVAELMPAALLAALVANQTFASGTVLVFDARAIGVGAAALAVAMRAPFALVVLIGAATTATIRFLGWA